MPAQASPTDELLTNHPGTARLLADVAAAPDNWRQRCTFHGPSRGRWDVYSPTAQHYLYPCSKGPVWCPTNTDASEWTVRVFVDETYARHCLAAAPPPPDLARNLTAPEDVVDPHAAPPPALRIAQRGDTTSVLSPDGRWWLGLECGQPTWYPQPESEPGREVFVWHGSTFLHCRDRVPPVPPTEPLTKRPVAPYTHPGPMAGDTRWRTDAPLSLPDLLTTKELAHERKFSRLDAMLDVAQEFTRLGMFAAYDVVMGLYHKERSGGAA